MKYLQKIHTLEIRAMCSYCTCFIQSTDQIQIPNDALADKTELKKILLFNKLFITLYQ